MSRPRLACAARPARPAALAAAASVVRRRGVPRAARLAALTASARRAVARAVPLVALIAAALLIPAASAPAEAVSSAELRALATRAADDQAALERLRGVESVDGRPADLSAALAGARGEELRARLEVLAGEPAQVAGDAAAARAEARDIVAGRRFSPPEVPGPFRGLLERLADWLAPVLDIIPALDDVVPGGRPVVWAVLLLLVASVTAVLAGRSLRRRSAAPGARSQPGAVTDDDDPDALERRARAAAARGEYELALRLGFRAGLVRLARRGVIEPRPSVSTGEIARAVRLPQFDRAAARFDEIVYGGRPAAASDVAAADEAWADVLRDRRAA